MSLNTANCGRKVFAFRIDCAEAPVESTARLKKFPGEDYTAQREGIMRIVFLSWVLLTSACCSGLKNAVADHSKSVRQLTQASLAALPPCKEGKPQACEIVQSNLQAIDASAAELKKLSE